MKLRGNMLTIFNLFVQHKRLTDFELENLCEINCNSIRGARLKLEQKRLIRRTEEKKNHFQYQAKIRIGIIGFVLFLLLSTTTAYKILNLIIQNTQV